MKKNWAVYRRSSVTWAKGWGNWVKYSTAKSKEEALQTIQDMRRHEKKWEAKTKYQYKIGA